MLHPHTLVKYKNDLVGYGVYATEHIPAGTIIAAPDAMDVYIPHDSPLLSDPRYLPHIKRYSYMDPDGNHLVSWDLTKYINHCCQCNTMLSPYGFEMAICDIAPGEEITEEYAMYDFWQEMDLVCEQANCRKRQTFGDFDQLWRGWDAQMKPALARFFAVPQPLLEFLDEPTVNAIRQYLATGEGYKSVWTLKYGEKPLPEGSEK